MLTRGREVQAHASPDSVLSPLPCCFVRAVLLLLPVDARLRCCEVSRARRALLADTTLWARISLCPSSGVARFSEALLRAAVAKAGGQLRTLDFRGQLRLVGGDHLTRLLFDVVAANAATLKELRVDTGQFWQESKDVRALLEAAPGLQLLEASVETKDRQVARAMLRNEPPFQALRLQKLCITFRLVPQVWFYSVQTCAVTRR